MNHKAKTRRPASPAFTKVLAEIRRHGNARIGLASYKFNARRTDLRANLAQLLNLPAYRMLVWPRIKATRHAELFSTGLPYVAPLEIEAEWLAQTVSPYAAIINAFLSRKKEAERLLLAGKLDECSVVLDEIELEFGLSVWLLEARIELTQLREGYSKRREFSDALMDLEDLSPLISYIIGWFSFRSGQNITAEEFRRLTTTIPKTAIFILARIAIGDRPELDPELTREVLGQLDGLALIDRYELGTRVIQLFCASQPITDIVLQVADSMGALSRVVSDVRLTNLGILATKAAAISSVDESLLEGMDAFLEGRYSSAVESARNSPDWGHSVEALSLFLMAVVAGDISERPGSSQNSLFERITSDLRSVLSYASDAAGAYSRLSKVTLTRANSGWASALNLVLARQGRDERLFTPSISQRYDAFEAEYFDPRLAFEFDHVGAGHSYLNAIPSELQKNPSVLLNSSILGGDVKFSFDTLASPTKERALAVKLMRTGAPAEAITILETTYKNQSQPYWKCDVGLILAEALLRTNQFRKCAEICADLYLISAYLGQLLPIARLVSNLLNRDEEAPRSELYLGALPTVITLDIYSRVISTDQDARRGDALKDFLTAEKISLPSELYARRDHLPKAQYIYFLRFACVPAVLDQLLVLENSKAVEDERARILVQLDELLGSDDSAELLSLREELQDIRTRQVVRDTTLQLDQSKIYVDVEGVKKTLGGQLKDRWQLFQLLGTQKAIGEPDNALYEAIRKALGERIEIVSLRPGTEKSRVFAQIIGSVRDAFTVNKLFGLDANLSTNIRHGFILRELRKPFIVARLVTNRPTRDTPYQDNRYWLDKIVGEEERHEGLASALNKLSATVDGVIETLVGETLRIRSDQAPNGLFDFRLTELEAQVLQSRAESVQTYEEFLDLLFAFFWARTDELLVVVRSHLMENTLPHLQGALTTLQEDVETCCSDRSAYVLTNAINLVRPDVRSAVERVASWFTLSGSREYLDFPLSVAFEAGLATVASYYSNIRFVPALDVESVPLVEGWTLPYFARLFTILLENSAAHSGFTSGNLNISVAASAVGGQLEIRVSNKLAQSIDLDGLRAVIKRLNAEFGRDAASDYVPREGRSGYPKIWKILTHDLRRDHALAVALAGDEFVVEILLNTEGVIT